MSCPYGENLGVLLPTCTSAIPPLQSECANVVWIDFVGMQGVTVVVACASPHIPLGTRPRHQVHAGFLPHSASGGGTLYRNLAKRPSRNSAWETGLQGQTLGIVFRAAAIPDDPATTGCLPDCSRRVSV
jgi:hypothetical protein